MLATLKDAVGASALNWLLIAAAGLVFVAAAAALPAILRRLRDKDGAPLF